MVLWGRERRRKKRYNVSWEACLNIDFHDLRGKINARVINFSGIGVRVHSSRIYLNRRHLILSDPQPDLEIIICTPTGDLINEIEIQWFNQYIEKNIFEIGIGFINMAKKNEFFVDKLIKRLGQRSSYV